MPAYGISFTAYYTAWDTANNVGKTGDSANHTLYWTKDGTASAATNSAAEVDSTNAPGLYKVTISATEASCLAGAIGGVSSTSDIALISTIYDFLHVPNAAPGASGGLPTVDASNLIAGIQGTLNQLDDLNNYAGGDTSGTTTLLSRLGTPVGASISADIASVQTDTSAIVDDTGTSGVVVASASKTGYTLSNTGIDALFTRQLTEAYNTDGTAPTVAQVLHGIMAFLFERSVNGTTLTVKKLDGSTTAMTFTLNDASSPTSITRAT